MIRIRGRCDVCGRFREIAWDGDGKFTCAACRMSSTHCLCGARLYDSWRWKTGRPKR